MLTACGGGGGGSTQTPAPSISSLSYSPNSTSASSTDIAISGSFNFTSSADLATLKIVDSDNNVNESLISEVAGLRSGTIEIPSAAIKGNPARDYSFTISVIDKSGGESNKLTGKISIQRAALLAVAGNHRTTYANAAVNLSGAAINTNGTTTSYLWTLVGSSPGVTGVIASPTSQTTTFTPSTTGVFRLGFQISDGTAASPVSQLRVTSLPPGKFSLFSTTAQLISVQGQPSTLSPGVAGLSDYQYGPRTTVTVSSQSDCVIGWNDYGNILKLLMLPATWLTNGQSHLSLTSTLDDVIRIQGTPTSYSYSNFTGQSLTYGLGNEVIVSPTTGLVTRWRSSDGTLKLAP